MLLLLGTAIAADMAWQCLSFTTAAEAVDYRDASADGGLRDAYDTLYAVIDANCVVTTCSDAAICEEIVDCVTEAGDTVNWQYLEEGTFGGGRWSSETVGVVPAEGSDLGWTEAAITVEERHEHYSGAFTSTNWALSYTGAWDDGFPVDGTILAATGLDSKGGEWDSWDDGACSWSRDLWDWYPWSLRWTVTVNGETLLVEYVYGDDACYPTLGEAQVQLNGTYIGLVDQETWEAIPDADLDTSPDAVDCDDADPNRGTCEPENPHDSIDNNCDGVADDGDADGDGFLSPESAGDDCNDNNATTFPGAPDRAGDGVDSDCNGADPASLPRHTWGAGPLVWTRGAR